MLYLNISFAEIISDFPVTCKLKFWREDRENRRKDLTKITITVAIPQFI